MIKLNKSDIKRLIEQVLKEATYDINDDVNLIYDIYFKHDIDEIKKTNYITHNMFPQNQTHTKVLKSEIAKKANKIKPCTIFLNLKDGKSHSYYNPSENFIAISVHKNAAEFIIYDYNGSITKAKEAFENISSEFTTEKIKGSIAHELTHWIDDALKNNSISNEINKINTRRKNKKISRDINTTYFEINSQIAAIKQAKIQMENKWDIITFRELINYSPPLRTIYNSLKYEEREEWLKTLKKRMYRENLLGKKMYN